MHCGHCCLNLAQEVVVILVVKFPHRFVDAWNHVDNQGSLGAWDAHLRQRLQAGPEYCTIARRSDRGLLQGAPRDYLLFGLIIYSAAPWGFPCTYFFSALYASSPPPLCSLRLARYGYRIPVASSFVRMNSTLYSLPSAFMYFAFDSSSVGIMGLSMS